MTHVANLHIENCETIAMLCYRWGKKADNPLATRLYKLLMILRSHHMGRKLCPNCMELLAKSIGKTMADLGVAEMSMRRLRELAGEATDA